MITLKVLYFRDDQAIAYTSLKKDLDQTTKNCRILSFKLRKAERKSVQLETEKQDVEKQLKDVRVVISLILILIYNKRFRFQVVGQH